MINYPQIPKIATGHNAQASLKALWELNSCAFQRYKSRHNRIQCEYSTTKQNNAAYVLKQIARPSARWVIPSLNAMEYRILVDYLFSGADSAPVTVYTLNTELYQWKYYNGTALLPTITSDFKTITLDITLLKEITP